MTAEISDEAVTRVVEGNNAFAIDLYHQLSQQAGNLFFSPYSISTALAMTYMGARGETAAQMAKVLHFALDQDQLHTAFAALMADLDSNQEGYQLSLANRLWGQQGFHFLNEFLKTTQHYYKAALAVVDFMAATEETRQTINSWVAQQTQEKIQNLIPKGVVDSTTQLVLTNAIYFKGEWARQFDPAVTEKQPFTISLNQRVSVTMMHQKGEFYYTTSRGLQVLELPYVGNRLSMVILLPEKVDGLAELEQRLTRETLERWLMNLQPAENVHVWLPKFQLTSMFKLSEVLSDLGMPLAFDSTADLSGIADDQNLWISQVLHKAFVEVNEEGTEAAAATAVILSRSMSLPPTFKADHPFIFLIWDTQSGSIPFLGRVVNPLL